MPGLSRPRQSQTPRLRETEQPTRSGTSTPCEHDEIGARDRSSNVAIVVGPDRIGDATQLARIRRAVCEEIHNLHAAESPGLREADAAADRRIVAPRVGGRGIEHHKRYDRPRSVPAPPEPIAVTAIGAEGGSTHRGGRA